MRHNIPTPTLVTIAATPPGAIAAIGEKCCFRQLVAVSGIVRPCWCLRSGIGLPIFTPSEQEACRRRSGPRSFLCCSWVMMVSCQRRLQRSMANDQSHLSWGHLVHLRSDSKIVMRAQNGLSKQRISIPRLFTEPHAVWLLPQEHLVARHSSANAAPTHGTQQ